MRQIIAKLKNKYANQKEIYLHNLLFKKNKQMKRIKQILAIAIFGIFAVACSDDEEQQINQQSSVITKSEITNEMALSYYNTIKPDLAEGLINFNNEVSEVFKNSSSYEDFKTKLCGTNIIDTIGENLLKVSYKYLKAGYSDNYIYENYNGKEMLEALSYLLANPNSDGSELFGFKTVKTKEASPCKWYQVGCHLNHALEATEKWIKEHKETIDTTIKLATLLVAIIAL